MIFEWTPKKLFKDYVLNNAHKWSHLGCYDKRNTYVLISWIFLHFSSQKCDSYATVLSCFSWTISIQVKNVPLIPMPINVDQCWLMPTNSLRGIDQHWSAMICSLIMSGPKSSQEVAQNSFPWPLLFSLSIMSSTQYSGWVPYQYQINIDHCQYSSRPF